MRFAVALSAALAALLFCQSADAWGGRQRVIVQRQVISRPVVVQRQRVFVPRQQVIVQPHYFAPQAIVAPSVVYPHSQTIIVAP